MADGSDATGKDRPPVSKRSNRAPRRAAGRKLGSVTATVPSAGKRPSAPADWIDLRPNGAFRPPDYRWWLANRLAAGGLVPDEWVDPWVLRAEEALTTPPSPWLDAPDLRAVAAARDLYERGPYWQKIELEARLLAGQGAEVIAAKTGLTTAAVEAYEALFFAVSDRLRYSGHIVHVVVGFHAPGAESDLGVQVRMFGYNGGPFVLDAVLDAVDRPGVRPDEDVSTEDRELRKLVRLALGLRMTPVTEENALQWGRLYFLRRECQALGVRPR